MSTLREALVGSTGGLMMVWHQTQPTQDYWEWCTWLPCLVITVMNTPPPAGPSLGGHGSASLIASMHGAWHVVPRPPTTDHI